MSYRVLVLPQVATMTPELLRKLKELTAAGATIVGAPPVKSPSLSHYPACDTEVKSLAAELWGSGAVPEQLSERRFGKGRIFWGGPFKSMAGATTVEDNSLGAARWIWFKEGNPAASAPPGTRYFRRAVNVVSGSELASARLLMTADNTFTCYVNGRKAGSGNEWETLHALELKPWLKPGGNLLCVAAVNTTDSPSPAGLIGLLRLRYADGRVVEIPTDARWDAANTAPAKWLQDTTAAASWTTAMELGAVGMAPWGTPRAPAENVDPIPNIALVEEVMQRLGVPPDFAAQTKQAAEKLRYIHRALDGSEVYFVANPYSHEVDAVGSFRVAGRQPELWWPESGRREGAGVYETSGEITRVPLHLDSFESVFVLFRPGEKARPDRIVAVTRNSEPILDANDGSRAAAPDELFRVAYDSAGSLQALLPAAGSYTFKSAAGDCKSVENPALPGPLELGGPWNVRFEPGCGAPEQITLDKLISWSEHPDPGVKYFSGHAAYSRTVTIPESFVGQDRRLYLDLGKVAVMAEVTLNGKYLGILWKAPFRIDITEAAKAGENQLEIRVVNLWVNRQIGDEQLPEDSERNANGTLKSWPAWLTENKPSPTGRSTFTSWRLWKKDSALVESGLLGPVRIQAACAKTLVNPTDRR
jgi:hypothetical protein